MEKMCAGGGDDDGKFVVDPFFLFIFTNKLIRISLLY